METQRGKGYSLVHPVRGKGARFEPLSLRAQKQLTLPSLCDLSGSEIGIKEVT